jgi:hypothetical protein
MNPNLEKPGAAEGSRTRFCALEYAPQDSSKPRSIVLLALDNQRGKLRLLVNRDWRELAHAEDKDYLESLLEDLKERAGLAPESLFKQLCSLGVGPLLTQATGEDFLGDARIMKLCSSFVEI